MLSRRKIYYRASIIYLDGGYVDGEILATTPTDYGIEITGPARPNVSYQAKANQGYDASSVFGF